MDRRVIKFNLEMEAARANDAMRRRDDLIVEASRRGDLSLREIGTLVGLGHSTIARIVGKANARGTADA